MSDKVTDKLDCSSIPQSQPRPVLPEQKGNSVRCELLVNNQNIMTDHPDMDAAYKYIDVLCIRNNFNYWPYAFFSWLQ